MGGKGGKEKGIREEERLVLDKECPAQRGNHRARGNGHAAALASNGAAMGCALHPGGTGTSLGSGFLRRGA